MFARKRGTALGENGWPLGDDDTCGMPVRGPPVASGPRVGLTHLPAWLSLRSGCSHAPEQLSPGGVGLHYMEQSPLLPASGTPFLSGMEGAESAEEGDRLSVLNSGQILLELLLQNL